MARARKKNEKLTAEVSLIDEIYVETDDSLRGFLLEKVAIEEKIANLQCIIRDEAAKRDPNRNIFHVGGLAEFEAVSDEAKKQLFVEEENKKALDEKIAKVENRLEILHKVRKVLYKADNPEAQEEVEEIIEEVVDNNDSTNVEQILKDDCLGKLKAANDKLELSNRFLTFDPERSRLEMISAGDCISEIIEIINSIISKEK